MALKIICGALFEVFIKLFEKYGIIKSVGYIALLGVFSMSIYSSIVLITLDERIDTSVTKALDVRDKQKEIDHQEGLVRRVENIKIINALIKETMYELGADRASIIEMHNGTNNVDGLPFLYGEMTYEQVRMGVDHVDDLYIKMNLTRYVFPLYLSEKNYFVGSIEEVSKIDDKIARKMESEGTRFVVVFGLHGVTSPIGYLAFTWNGEEFPNITNSELSRISVIAQKVSNLLRQK